MNLSKAPRYLLDVNVLIPLTAKNHIHHRLVHGWFMASPDIKWAICAFTEAGFVRNSIAPREDQISVSDATYILRDLVQHPGYRYIPIDTDWETLCRPFFKRLYGHNQVTDAYLLGLAVRQNLVLATMDKGILHLAGQEYAQHVLLLRNL
jgi:toxin-antitoxin system PIN domain toxin